MQSVSLSMFSATEPSLSLSLSNHIYLPVREKRLSTITNHSKLSELRESQRELEVNFANVVEERDELYNTFEGTVRSVQQKTDLRCVLALLLKLLQRYSSSVVIDDAP